MACDIFLKVEGINGEAQDKDHKGEIDILAWSWGVSQSGTMHLGGGGGAGKANAQDISVTKYIDKSSPLLIKACTKGTHIKSAKLTVRKAGDKPLEYIIIELSDCLISSVSNGGSGGEDRLTENMTINFAEIKFTYTPQKFDGSADGKVPFGFNFSTNTDA